MLFGLAAPVIGRFASETDSDGILICTRARTGFKRAIRGSVAESVMASSDVPVIVAHAGDEIRAGGPVSTFYSRPGQGDTCDAFGRVTAADIPAALIEKRARFYLCGPGAMMDQVTEGLIARGVFPFEIFRERFLSPLPAHGASNGPLSIRFARSGREVTWTAKAGSILACAEAAGVSLLAGCKVGQCESCAVPILSGEVLYASDLPGAEDGTCLTCQAIPTSDLVLNA